VRVLVEGEGAERKLAFEYIPAEPKPKKAKGDDEDEESDEEDEDSAALVDATPRKALLAPRDAKKDRPRSSGTVPSVPRRKDD
jgi:ATP-dependent Clp protease ATP-binding subunit ClpA